MKRVVSISLGSSTRDAEADVQLLDEEIYVRRIGTDGDTEKAAALFAEFDGKADALGLGGTDLYLSAGGRDYPLRESFRLIRGAVHTPVLDGSGLKKAWEPQVINFLEEKGIVTFADKKVLHVCGVDRYGMAKALVEKGAEITFGDAVFALGLDFPLHSLQGLDRLAKIAAPVVTRMPIHWLYPVGEKQEKQKSAYTSYFNDNDIIVGDFHYIRRYMPSKLQGKTVITGTITGEDRELLRRAEASCLITTTPEWEGRSFGTNVLEAVLVALAGKQGQLTGEEYLNIITECGLQPGITYF